MATEIEKWLYRGGTQGVTEIVLSAKRITLTVAPWEGDWLPTTVEFRESWLLSVEVYADGPEDLNLPWDIIGFDSYAISENRWKFVLHCAGVEYVFESLWPVRITG